MQYVAYIPVFLIALFGGSYLFDQSHDKTPITTVEQTPVQAVEQPKIEKNIPEPTIEKKTVSVPTSQPVVKPTEKKKKKGGISKSDRKLMEDIANLSDETDASIARGKAEYDRLNAYAHEPIKVNKPKPLVRPSWNCKNTISKNKQGKTYVSSIDCN